MKKGSFFLLLLSAVAALGVAQNDLQPAAIVNLTRSEPITVKQFRNEVERMERGTGRTLDTAERRQLLDILINEKLAIQAAERDKISISENEVNQQLQQLRDGIAQSIGRPPTDAEFSQAIRNETALDLPAFREQLRRQILVNKYLQFKKQDIFETVKAPTEAEIENRYNLERAKYVRPDTVRFSMIQVVFGDDAAEKARAKELAERLSREIGSSPAKFDEVVLRGQVPDAGFKAGDAGFLPKNLEAQQLMGEDFIKTAFSLKQGEVSKLTEGAQSYQIIKVTETYSMKNLELGDIFQLGTRITVRDYIGNLLLQERRQGAIAKATKELLTELRAGKTFQVFEKNITW
ncbi:MAG: peptidyl-prolyl cis-trans isomerase [Treponema sp.]|jgi:parvulin-like peptidyl-prolyl isomerase|nr:peptidyl-prolyl cis-trans isomerase [Treponema sp.]